MAKINEVIIIPSLKKSLLISNKLKDSTAMLLSPRQRSEEQREK